MAGMLVHETAAAFELVLDWKLDGGITSPRFQDSVLDMTGPNRRTGLVSLVAFSIASTNQGGGFIESVRTTQEIRSFIDRPGGAEAAIGTSLCGTPEGIAMVELLDSVVEFQLAGRDRRVPQLSAAAPVDAEERVHYFNAVTGFTFGVMAQQASARTDDEVWAMLSDYQISVSRMGER